MYRDILDFFLPLLLLRFVLLRKGEGRKGKKCKFSRAIITLECERCICPSSVRNSFIIKRCFLELIKRGRWPVAVSSGYEGCESSSRRVEKGGKGERKEEKKRKKNYSPGLIVYVTRVPSI